MSYRSAAPTHTPVGTCRAARSRSHPRIPVPTIAKRILRPVSLPAASAAGASSVASTAATAPAPSRTNSRLVKENRFTRAPPPRPQFSLSAPTGVYTLQNFCHPDRAKRVEKPGAPPSARFLRLQFPLWSEGTVPVDTAALKEAVMYHALGKQKNGDCQGN